MNRKLLFAQKIRSRNKMIVATSLLNFLLMAIIFYFCFRESILPASFDFRPVTAEERAAKLSNPEVIVSYYQLPFQELVEKLKLTHPVEDGYRVRDVALGIMVARDELDIERALNRKIDSKRVVAVNDKRCVLFPNLKDEEFQKVAAFIQRETWPLTSHGIFRALSKLPKADPSLVAAAYLTPEFHLLEQLFKEATPQIPKATLLDCIKESHFKHLANFYEEQKKGIDLTPAKRRELLVACLDSGSKTAGVVLLLTEPSFALHDLSDPQLIKLLEGLPNVPKTQEFAKKILTTPRGDAIVAKAKSFLPQQEVVQIRPPRAATGQLRPTFRDRPPSAPATNQHVIQPGESLTSIAKKYNVSRETLMKHNQLQTTTLRVGKTLKIPK